uniref:Large ribosomal subunit protein uL6c n=1 Tax=Bangiopsis subsimplex TaxID=139980 RepID=A0A1C9CD20_9RHOD|nr:ribosomal protein L6 [Bangiopsis subsimplex]AOM66262.1 ribosomal protein L6 [Bangiopsis subsimplex]ARO90376.1 50S ribosomal protein L6 [Bangiopsis subsimplex]
MSRIGKKYVEIPSSVEIKINNNIITAKGPKGNLESSIPQNIEVTLDQQNIIVKKLESSRKAQQLYGLTRTLINNIVLGVSEGFSKNLEITGVGYRAQMDNKNLILNMGYSHPVTIQPPENIIITVNKNTAITVTGPNKELVGQVASNIRAVRPPEPYKGKGIRYQGEVIKRKVGKAGRGK